MCRVCLSNSCKQKKNIHERVSCSLLSTQPEQRGQRKSLNIFTSWQIINIYISLIFFLGRKMSLVGLLRDQTVLLISPVPLIQSGHFKTELSSVIKSECTDNRSPNSRRGHLFITEAKQKTLFLISEIGSTAPWATHKCRLAYSYRTTSGKNQAPLILLLQFNYKANITNIH